MTSVRLIAANDNQIEQMERCKEKEGMIPISLLHDMFDYNPNGWLVSRKTGERAGYTDEYGYRMIGIGELYYREHRMVWAMHNGRWPTDYIDHRDRIRSHNTIENLREVDISTNAHNSGLQTNNTSGYTGVTYRKARRRWVARVTVNGERYVVGAHYRSPEEAAEDRIIHLLNLGQEIAA